MLLSMIYEMELSLNSNLYVCHINSSEMIKKAPHFRERLLVIAIGLLDDPLEAY